MTRRAVELMVGAIVLLGLAAGFTAVSFIGKFNPLVEKNILYVHFPNAEFLGRGANVRAEGLNVGRVHQIDLAADGVIATLIVDEDVQVHDGYAVYIKSLSILGGRYVEVVLGDEHRTTVESTPERPLTGSAEPDLFKSVAEILEGAAPLIASATSNINETMDRLAGAQGSLGMILADENNELRENIQSAIQRFERTTMLLERMGKKVEEGTGTLGRLTNDARLTDAIAGTGARISSITDKVAAGGGPLGALLSDEDIGETLSRIGERLSAQLERVMKHAGAEADGEESELRRHLRGALDNIDRLIEKVRSGKGPILVLLSDPESKDAIERAQAHLEAFSNRPPTSSLDRIRSDRKVLNDFERVYLDFRESATDASDFSPMSSTVEGYLRGYIKNPPQKQSAIGGLSSSSTSSSDE